MNKRFEQSVKHYAKEISKRSDKYNLDPNLVAAIMLVESSGNPYAIRVEPGFWKRYSNAYHRIIKPNNPARKWLKYPDVFACSYGLMQIMYGVAVEHGCRVRFPTELLKAELNLEFGCRILAKKIKIKKDIKAGVLAYNGGGNPQYPNKVFRLKRGVEGLGIF